MAIELGVVLTSGRFDSASMPRPSGHGKDYSNTREVGLLLYTDYVYAFELAAVLLLVAIVAAIVLTLRRRPTTLYQSPSRQVRVTKAERLRVVQMPSEPRDKENQGDPS
jgi:NADH-quinone oxidoreductase subunit J